MVWTLLDKTHRDEPEQLALGGHYENKRTTEKPRIIRSGRTANADLGIGSGNATTIWSKKNTSPKQLIHPYIAISRESGVDAGEIATLVAKKFGWKVFDRELLDYMAEHYNWSRVALDYVDERTASWFHETFGKWLDQQMVTQAEYVSRLGKIVLLAAQHESNVFVGRGAQFILPRDRG